MLGTTAASGELRALVPGDLNILFDTLSLCLRHHRSDLRIRVHRIADNEAFHHLGEAANDFVIARTRDENARLVSTGLTAVAQRASPHALDYRRQVGVVEHDQRRLAAEFEIATTQVTAAYLGDASARCR